MTTIKLTLKTGVTVTAEVDISREQQNDIANNLLNGGDITIGCANSDITYHANEIERVEFIDEKPIIDETKDSPVIMEIRMKNGNIYDLITNDYILSATDKTWNQQFVLEYASAIKQVFNKNGSIRGTNAVIKIADVDMVALKDCNDSLLATITR